MLFFDSVQTVTWTKLPLHHHRNQYKSGYLIWNGIEYSKVQMGWIGLWANGVSFLSETWGSESVSIGATASGDGCGDPGWPRQCLQQKHHQSTEQKQEVSLETPINQIIWSRVAQKIPDRGPEIIWPNQKIWPPKPNQTKQTINWVQHILHGFMFNFLFESVYRLKNGGM